MFVRSLRWFRVSVRPVLLSLAVQHVGIAANSRVFRLHRPRLLRLLSHPRRRRFLRIAQGNQSRIIRIVVILRLNGIIEAKEILYVSFHSSSSNISIETSKWTKRDGNL